MSASGPPPRRRPPLWQRLLPWLVTAACFAYLYVRLDRAAAADGRRLGPYLAAVFGEVSWLRWLALMLPYCLVFLLIDGLVVWRVISWFNARLRYRDVLPIRASAYILSIVNEQVSEGAIALYVTVARASRPGKSARACSSSWSASTTTCCSAGRRSASCSSGSASRRSFTPSPGSRRRRWRSSSSSTCSSPAGSRWAAGCASGRSSAPSGRPPSGTTRA